MNSYMVNLDKLPSALKGQRFLILDLIVTLKQFPKSNACQLQEGLKSLSLPNYSLRAVYSCLKELQIMSVVSCEITRKVKEEDPSTTDYFTLNGERAKPLVEGLKKLGGHRRERQIKEGFAIVKCSKCGTYRYVAFPFKTVKCFNCNQPFSSSDIIQRVKTRNQAMRLLKTLKHACNKEEGVFYPI